MADKITKLEVKSAPEPDFLSLVRSIARNLWVIITVGIACMFCTYWVSLYTYTPTYTTSATLLVNAKSSTGTAVSDISAAKSAAEEMTVIFGSDIMQKTVVKQLGLSSFDATVSTSLVESTNLLTLQITADSQQLSYEILCAMLDNYDIVTEYASTDVVLSELEPPTVPTLASNGYSMLKRLAAAFAAGAVVIAAIVLLFNYMRNSVKNEREFDSKVDGTRLVSVRHEKKYKKAGKKLGRSKKGLLVNDIAVSYPFYESYKTLAVRLMHRASKYKRAHQEMKGGTVILVTSTLEDEGKSTVAVNLALSLAKKNRHVMLIDCDLRRPALQKILDRRSDITCGLADYLKGNPAAERDMVLYDKKINLYMILNKRASSRSAELLAYPRMQQLLDEMKECMDYIVLDSPPCAALADTEVLIKYADMKVLVIRQDMALTEDINDVIDSLEKNGSPLTGCVFNDVRLGPFSSAIASTGGYGRYGYGRYGYGRYGGYGRYSYGRYGYGRYGYGRYERMYNERANRPDPEPLLEAKEQAALREDPQIDLKGASGDN